MQQQQNCKTWKKELNESDNILTNQSACISSCRSCSLTGSGVFSVLVGSADLILSLSLSSFFSDFFMSVFDRDIFVF